LYQSSTSKILREAVILSFLVFFFNLLLPNRDLLLLLIWATVGMMASLLAHKAQAFSHAISTFFFI
jgi:hypothetical protein